MSQANDAPRADIGARTSYPATFPISAASRIVSWLFGTLVLIASLFIAGMAARSHVPVIVVGFMVVFFLIAAAVTVRSATMKLILGEREATLSTVFGARNVRRQDITGRSAIKSYVRFDVRDGRPFSVPLELFKRARVGTWLGDIPDQAEIAQAAFLEKVKADTSLGVDAESRLAALKRSRALATGLQIGAVMVYFVSRFNSEYQGWCVAILAAFPWIALAAVAMNPKLLRLGVGKDDPRPTVATALLFPVIALFIIGLDLDVLEKVGVWPWATIPAVLLAMATMAASRQENGSAGLRLACALVLGCGYGFSAALVADVMLDTAPSTRYETAVINHSITRGKYTHYYLDLAPWGPRTNGEHLSVSRVTYDANQVGASVCMQLHPGALKLPWAGLGSCRT
ncbi:hypothetical protein [Pinirhizobacter soli]|uniref:hypothetical protein n=1 Tax=Pinirhizobacter soli TaxID=2786953 RepID=UPI002029E270|nr:hypothetical protein [Pinirhizobacter soli]